MTVKPNNYMNTCIYLIPIAMSPITALFLISFMNLGILSCPPDIGWIPAGESCYLIGTEFLNWFASQEVD